MSCSVRTIRNHIPRQSITNECSVVAKVFFAWSGAMHKVSAKVQNLVNQRVREKTFTSEKKEREEHVRIFY